MMPYGANAMGVSGKGMRRMIGRKLGLIFIFALPLTIVSCKKSGSDAKLDSPDTVGADVSVQSQQTDGNCVDTPPVGDGWGWDGTDSCRLEASDSTDGAENQSNQPSILDNCYKLQSGEYHLTELVTDVILTAGQSNATGENTQFQPGQFSEDKLSDRILVWTENNQWEVADPATQTWHGGKYPSGKGSIYNHPAFQIGRAITAKEECRVVALITTAASGKDINYWRYDLDGHFSEIGNTVNSAINALPIRHQVDMIWWMQGEADNDQVVDRYFRKLNELITMFRGEAWFSTNGYFLANETGWFPYANQAIRLLRTDDDELTDYSRGEDTDADPFPSLNEHDVDVHFSEVSLRKIGNLVADKYLNDYVGL